MKVEIKTYLERQRQLVEDFLDQLMLTAEGPFAAHIEAMRYSLFVGGKRLRPILCLAAARTVSSNPDIDQVVLPICCALECIHTYSLIHDDLPAMDNDELRRGKPTNHFVYGEAQAILAGDGLLTYAFDLLSQDAFNDGLPSETRIRIIQLISQAAGSQGMVGGQSLDVANEGKPYTPELLNTMHSAKTGALITASILTGAVAGGCSVEQESALASYGRSIGLAFQIVDDLLDIESTTEVLGKPAGSDQSLNKATFPALYGIEQSKTMAREAVDTALAALTLFDQRSDPLRKLAVYIVEREK
jgi:geranylgeranyl diphosphate synthase, type II